MEIKNECQFKDVCGSDYCDDCRCMNCTTKCEWDGDRCPRDDFQLN